MNKLNENLNWRYACKAFDSEKKLSEEQLDNLLEALILSPSSYGAQPWSFIVVKNQALREKLVGASYNQAQVKDASDLIVLCRPENIDEEFIDGYIKNICDVRNQQAEELAGFKNMLMKIVDKPEEQKIVWAKNQIYIALGNLLTACAEMRIDSCPMEGFSPKSVDEILELSKWGLKSVLLCPVGFRSEDDKYAKIAKVRQPKEKVVRIIE